VSISIKANPTYVFIITLIIDVSMKFNSETKLIRFLEYF